MHAGAFLVWIQLLDMAGGPYVSPAGGIVCGTASVAPRTGGTASVAARTGGTASAAPRTGGTTYIDEC